MGWKRTMALTVGMALLLGISAAAAAPDQESSLPSFGSGPVEVRLYTDYFCPPCRALEPELEPLLEDLVKGNAVRLVFVDVPLNPLTPLFARNFLYAVKADRDLARSLKARRILQEAAAKKDIKTQGQLEALFREKGVAFKVFDTKNVFVRYNSLLKEDKINATPTLVIIRNGQREVFVGGPAVIKAIKAIE